MISLAFSVSNCTPGLPGIMVLPSSLLTVALIGLPVMSSAIWPMSIAGAAVTSVETSYGSKSISSICEVSACSTAAVSNCTPGVPDWITRFSPSSFHVGATGSVRAFPAISSSCTLRPSSSTEAASRVSQPFRMELIMALMRVSGPPSRPTCHAFSADWMSSTPLSTFSTGIS